MTDFLENDSEMRGVKTDVVGVITYVGTCIGADNDTSKAIWLIKRVVKIGTNFTIEWASERYDQIWDDRATLFSVLPFINAFSILFDGVDEELRVEDDASLNFERTDPFTLSAWVKPTDLIGSQTIVNKESNDTALKGYGFLLNTSRLRFIARNDNVTSNRLIVETGTGIVTAGEYAHVLVTYDGSSTPAGVKLYVDAVVKTNVIVTDALTASIQNTEKLRIGRRSLGDSAYDGNIDEVTIWDKVLTPTEIGELYNVGIPNDAALHSATANLISYWKMGDGAAFPIIPDDKGSNDGTMINGESGDIVQDIP